MAKQFAPLFGMVALVLSILAPAPAHAQYWQCVGYAREITGVDIHGDAHTWWGQAEGRYVRGKLPREGAVMAFRSSSAMPLGHVAVVSQIVSSREVLLDHANWSRGGRVEHGARAIDVSEAGDWSAVKVWFGPIGDMGKRVNPVSGFIYPDEAVAPAPRPQFALSKDVIQLAALEMASSR
jgi:CHAP domain